MQWSIDMKKTKKGPLSKKEKAFIQKNIKLNTIDELAESISRSSSVVEKFAKTLPSAVTTNTKNDDGPTASNLYAKNEERGVTVMTETASMAADESKRKRKSGQSPERYTKCIHKIKE